MKLHLFVSSYLTGLVNHLSQLIVTQAFLRVVNMVSPCLRGFFGCLAQSKDMRVRLVGDYIVRMWVWMLICLYMSALQLVTCLRCALFCPNDGWDGALALLRPWTQDECRIKKMDEWILVLSSKLKKNPACFQPRKQLPFCPLSHTPAWRNVFFQISIVPKYIKSMTKCETVTFTRGHKRFVRKNIYFGWTKIYGCLDWEWPFPVYNGTVQCWLSCFTHVTSEGAVTWHTRRNDA